MSTTICTTPTSRDVQEAQEIQESPQPPSQEHEEQAKSIFLSLTEIFPPQKVSLIDRRDKFMVQAKLVYVAHGTYTPKGDFASLICVSHNFTSTIYARQFHKAKIQYQFYSSTSKSRPEVIEIYPTEEYNKSAPIKRKSTSSTYVSLGDACNGTSVFNTLLVRKERESSTEHAAVTKGEKKFSSPKKLSAPGGEDIALWTISENKQFPGIPARFRTVMLLKRRDHEKFFAKLDIEAHVDFKQRLEDMWGGRMDTKPLCFDPKGGPKVVVGIGEVPEGLEVGNLRKFWDECVVGGRAQIHELGIGSGGITLNNTDKCASY